MDSVFMDDIALDTTGVWSDGFQLDELGEAVAEILELNRDEGKDKSDLTRPRGNDKTVIPAGGADG